MKLTKKRILVTGACGTVGKELVRQLLEECKVKELVGLDNNESELFYLEHKYAGHSDQRPGRSDDPGVGTRLMLETGRYKN